MNKLLTLLLFAIATSNYGQITFENYYPYPNGGTAIPPMRLVKMSSAGYKYVINNKDTLRLYNLNHSLYLTIKIPTLTPPVSSSFPYVRAMYISDELFNTNPSDVEYLVIYNDASSVGHCRVFDQSGNILLAKDSTSFVIQEIEGDENFITYTSSGVKMIVGRTNGSGGSIGSTVYSLPGILPCHDCTNGTITNRINQSENPKGGQISNYPNPAIGQTTVEYNLPQGVTTADLVFYNITGQEIKRFKVTNAFHDILISTADIEAGTYYYQMQTSTGFSAGKKMVVIK